MISDPFPYDLTPAENDEQHRWEKVQLDKEAKQKKKDNFKIKAANTFRARIYKIKLKEANPMGDHIKLYKAWISEQQRKGDCSD
jgi:hypothetical protein